VIVFKYSKKSQEYDLIREMNRSARSVATNIAEGFSRRSEQKIFHYHLGVALGEANEMLVHINFARDFNVFSIENAEELQANYTILCKKISVFRERNAEFL